MLILLWYDETGVASYELLVESLKAQVEIQNCEFKSKVGTKDEVNILGSSTSQKTQ